MVVLGMTLRELILPLALSSAGTYIAYYPGLGTPIIFMFLAVLFTPIGPFFCEPHVTKLMYMLSNQTVAAFSRALARAAMQLATKVELLAHWGTIGENLFQGAFEKVIAKIDTLSKDATKFIRMIIADLVDQIDEVRDIIRYVAERLDQASTNRTIWVNARILLQDLLGVEKIRGEIVQKTTGVCFDLANTLNIRPLFIQNAKNAITDVIGWANFLTEVVVISTSMMGEFRKVLPGGIFPGTADAAGAMNVSLADFNITSF